MELINRCCLSLRVLVPEYKSLPSTINTIPKIEPVGTSILRYFARSDYYLLAKRPTLASSNFTKLFN